MHLADQFEFDYAKRYSENSGDNGEVSIQDAATDARENGVKPDYRDARRITVADIIAEIQYRIDLAGNCHCGQCQFNQKIIRMLRQL